MQYSKYSILSWSILAVIVQFSSVMAGEAPSAAVAKPLSGGWSLPTGVMPKAEATASIDKSGVITVEGGGTRSTWPRGTVSPADRANMTAAFVYKTFTGDFILTVRKISHDKGKAVSWPGTPTYIIPARTSVTIST